jgi:hypothetical protein
MQRHLLKMATAIRMGDQYAPGAILVRDHHDAGTSTKREVGQHVAGGDRAQEKILRVVTRGVAAEMHISGTWQVGPVRHLQDEVPAVPGVRPRSGAGVAGPHHVALVLVLHVLLAIECQTATSS